VLLFKVNYGDVSGQNYLTSYQHESLTLSYQHCELRAQCLHQAERFATFLQPPTVQQMFDRIKAVGERSARIIFGPRREEVAGG
jgi:hypothetical protein